MIKTKLKPHSMGLFKVNRGRDLLMTMPITHEPMVRHRWIMTVHGSQGSKQFFVRSDNGINMTVRTEEISFMTTSAYRVPHYEWNPLTIKILDYIGEGSNPNYIRDWMMSHTDALTGRHGYAADYKRNVEMEKVGPVGDVIEKWLLDGVFISSFNHEVVYDQEMSNMELTIMFDRARIIL